MTISNAAAAARRSGLPSGPILAWVGKLLRAWRHRRDFYRLGEMTDAELADIGLKRADLHAAAGSPFGMDPTSRLGALAETRRFEAGRCERTAATSF